MLHAVGVEVIPNDLSCIVDAVAHGGQRARKIDGGPDVVAQQEPVSGSIIRCVPTDDISPIIEVTGERGAIFKAERVREDIAIGGALQGVFQVRELAAAQKETMEWRETDIPAKGGDL